MAFLDTKSTFVTFDVEITIESKSASSKQPVKNFSFKEFWIDFKMEQVKKIEYASLREVTKNADYIQKDVRYKI